MNAPRIRRGRRVLRAVAAAVLLVCATRAHAEPLAVTLRWEKIPGATRYEVEIAEDRAFAKVLERRTVRGTRLRWELPAPRTVFWRVRGLDSAGNVGDFSAAGLAGAPVAGPKPVSPASGAEAGTGAGTVVVLRWDASPFLERYRVEVASDAAFADPTVGETTDASWSFRAPATGTWHWRVGGSDIQGGAVAPGAVSRFVVAEPPPEIATTGPRSGGAVAGGAASTAAERGRVYTLGAHAGFFHNMGDVTAPRVGVEIGTMFGDRWHAFVGGSWFRARTGSRSPSGLAVHSEVQAVPIEAGIARAWALGTATDAYGKLAIGMTWVHARVTAPTQPALSGGSAAWGGGVAAGVQRRAGAGRVFLEAGATVADTTRGPVALRPAGLRGLVGYRLEVR